MFPTARRQYRQKPLVLFWLVLLSVLSGRALCAATPITDVFADLANIHKWDDSNGDTWDPFWADDGNLYAFNCDGRGFGKQSRNFAFHRLQGDTLTGLKGSLVNAMDAYGKADQKGPDGATWKALGQECIDGVFYAFVSRHTYGHESHDRMLRQTAVNASLIKSTDRGLTWTRTAAENYQSPMWPGPRFGAPYFIHYGQNGGQVTADGADQYVYALSNNGFWNGGDDYILARVPRRKLPDLNAADWTYYAGGAAQAPASWTSQITQASPVLSKPAQCGSGPAVYVPALQAYVLVVWYIPETLKKWFTPRELKYDFYQAPHPWGPWTCIKSVSDNFLGGAHMYGPSLCARFQEAVGPDVKLILFTSGCPFEDKPTGLYKMWTIPVVLKTTPVMPSVLVNDDDPRIKYQGHWTALTKRGCGYFHDDLHATTTVDDAVEFTFTGTGIDYMAEQFHDLGNVDVYIDGTLRQNVNLCRQNFPRISQVVAFSVQGLPAGSHTIKIVNRSTAYADLDAFRVYGAADTK